MRGMKSRCLLASSTRTAALRLFCVADSLVAFFFEAMKHDLGMRRGNSILSRRDLSRRIGVLSATLGKEKKFFSLEKRRFKRILKWRLNAIESASEEATLLGQSDGTQPR